MKSPKQWKPFEHMQLAIRAATRAYLYSNVSHIFESDLSCMPKSIIAIVINILAFLTFKAFVCV